MAPNRISRTRHNLGESFLFALDDIRQKLVEEAWTGNTQTPSNMLQMQYSDFVAWLYGPGDSAAEKAAGLEQQATAHAIGHALRNGAIDTAHEIVSNDLRAWCSDAAIHPATSSEIQAPKIEAPEIEDGLEL